MMWKSRISQPCPTCGEPDLIRGVKLALDRNIAGSLESISAYAFKHPPTQVEEFIEGKRAN